MMTNTIYGLGGFCSNCEQSHDHPFQNIIEQVEVSDQETEE